MSFLFQIKMKYLCKQIGGTAMERNIFVIWVMSALSSYYSAATTESFKELLNGIPDHLDAKQCIQLAKVFKLSDDVISTIESDRRPGSLLIEVLIEKCLLSASNISNFEYALTELGSEKCAKYVREIRKINPAVHPLISPGDYN